MIQYIIEVSLSWTILFGVFYLFLRKETFFSTNRWYLLSSLIVGLLFPLLKILAIDIWFSPDSSVGGLIIGMQAMPGQLAAVVDQNGPGFWGTAVPVLFIVYLAGVIVLLIRFLKGLFDISRLNRAGQHIEQHGHRIIRTDEEHLPFSFLNCIYISSVTGQDGSYDQIIKHELEHVKSHHSLDVLFLEILTIAFWFHPLIYLYKSALRQTHEYLADRAVLAEVPRNIYGKLLLGQTLSGIQVALVHHFFQAHLKKRINMMYQKKSGKMAWMKYALAAPVVMVLGNVFMSHQAGELRDIRHDQVEMNELVNISMDTIKPFSKDGDAEEVFKVVEHMPMWIGCETRECSDQKLMSFISEHLKYPKSARDLNIQGRVFAQFVINQEGKVEGTKIIRDIGGGCGEAVLAVLEEMNANAPVWQAGLQRGKKVRVLFTLPVSFALPDEEESDASEIIPGAKELIVHADINGQYLFGKVVNVLGERLAGVEITSIGTKASTMTDAKGEFHLVLSPQSKGVKFSHKGYPDYQLDYTPVIPAKGEVFKVVEQMPLFGDCETQDCSNRELISFIGKTLKYPKAAREQKIEGKSYVQFVIEKDGSATFLDVKRSLGEDTDEAMKSLIQSMNNPAPKWSPGLQRGQKVRVLYTMPIIFKLEKEVEVSESVDPNATLGTLIPNDIIELKPLIILDGERVEQGSLDFEMTPDQIESVNVLKGEAAVRKYGQDGQNGVIEITSKREDSGTKRIEGQLSTRYMADEIDSPLPLYLVDGTIATAAFVDNMDADKIATMDVLKGEKAIETYGEAARNGVIRITTKAKLNNDLSEEVEVPDVGQPMKSNNLQNVLEKGLKAFPEREIESDAFEKTNLKMVDERSVDIINVDGRRLTFDYQSPLEGTCRVIVSNLAGQQIHEGSFNKPVGTFRSDIELTQVAAGVYVLSIVQEGTVTSHKFTSIK